MSLLFLFITFYYLFVLYFFDYLFTLFLQHSYLSAYIFCKEYAGIISSIWPNKLFCSKQRFDTYKTIVITMKKIS